MTIDASTTNILLSCAIALQVWIVRELFKLKSKVSIIVAGCERCDPSLDTDQIKKHK